MALTSRNAATIVYIVPMVGLIAAAAAIAVKPALERSKIQIEQIEQQTVEVDK